VKRILIVAVLASLLVEIAGGAEQKRPASWRTEVLPPKPESVQGEGLFARFYHPAKGNPPWQAIIMLSGSQGGLVTARRRIEPLIASGYCVLSTAYFKAEGLPQDLVSVPLEFYDRAKTWLAKNSKVAQGGVAVIGGSKGGELALLLASRDPHIRCVVGIVPASHVFQGIAPRFHMSSSWSYEGKDLPFVPYVFNATFSKAVMETHKFHDVYQEALANAGENAEAARIPVEKSNAAVLLLSGKKDQMWPSTDMCNTIVERLKQEKFPHVLKHVAYDTDHSVGSVREHWIEIATFLRKHYVIKGRTKPLCDGRK
jgi:dienelactone hydrolase